MNVNEYEFMYCAKCDSAPGSPTLCASCLHNRRVIEKLRREVLVLQRALRIVEEVVTTTRER